MIKRVAAALRDRKKYENKDRGRRNCSRREFIWTRLFKMTDEGFGKKCESNTFEAKEEGEKFNGEAAAEEEMIIFDRSGKLLESLR